MEVARAHRDAGVPLDVVVQDWKSWKGDLWGEKHLDPKRYPDIRTAMKTLHEYHVHAVVSVWPNMQLGGRDHAEFAAAGLLLHDYSTYNAFLPEARALYWKQAEQDLYRGGFDGWWCDNSEPFTADDWCGETKQPEENRYRTVGGAHERYLDPAVANAFGLVHARGLFEHCPQKPMVNLTRAGWAGSQQYGTVLWAGDTSATWEELRREIAKGMSISLCGIPYWTVDTGAFFVGGMTCWRRWKGDSQAAPVWFWHGAYDDGVQDKGYQELYTRWLQFSCFLPVFRSHGTDTPREFWNFEEPFRSAILDAIRLRYRLMPYIRDMAEQVSTAHFTILRTMAFDFPQDPLAWDNQEQFLFGRHMLICPVTQPILYEAGDRQVETPPDAWPCYLPAGADWVDFWTGEQYSGGQTVRCQLTISHIPIFVRAGTTLPQQFGMQFAEDSMPVVYQTYPETVGSIENGV